MKMTTTVKTDKNPKGAGRKPKYKSGTKNATFRIPVDKQDYIRYVINRWLNKFS